MERLELIAKAIGMSLLESLPYLLASVAFVALASVAYASLCKSKKRDVAAPERLLRRAFPREIYRHPTQRVDRWNWLIANLFIVPCTAALTALITARLGAFVTHEAQALLGSRPSLLQAYGANVALQTVTLMYAYSFFDYWLHVADHKVPLFWALHRAHHSAEVLTFFTAPRANPLEHLQVALVTGTGMGLIGGILCYATGSPLLKASLLVTAGIKLAESALYTSLAHTHIPVSFGRFNAIYSGPIMHQLHHSAELRHRDKNLGGGVGIIWDVLFGTYYAPKPGEQFRIGANEDDIGANNPHLTLRSLYIEPCTRMWRLIFERKAVSGSDPATRAVPMERRI